MALYIPGPASSTIVIPLTGEQVNIAHGAVLLTMPDWFESRVLEALPIWTLNTAPVGSAAQFDIRVGGTSIFATLPTIAAGARTTRGAAAPAVFSAAFIAAGHVLAASANVTFHCLQVGSTTAGAGAKVGLPSRRGA